MVGIVDYGTGNLKSVQNALGRIGAENIVSSDFDTLQRCSHIILPGVGSAGWAMENLVASGLANQIKEFAQPVMGICLGMQIMCSYSEEDNTECLGIFPNSVKKMGNSDDNSNKVSIKIPHVGWNNLTSMESSLFNGLGEAPYVYFVHSYCAEVNERTIAKCYYGSDFSAAIGYRNFFGCQFHPEKSGYIGERILKNFLKM